MSVSSMSLSNGLHNQQPPTLCCQCAMCVSECLPQRMKVPSDYWKGCHCIFTHLLDSKEYQSLHDIFLFEYNSDLFNQHLLSYCVFIARISPFFIHVHPLSAFCLPSHRVLFAHISFFDKSFHFCCHGYYPADSTLPPGSAMVTAQPSGAFAHAQCAVPLDPISYFNGPNKRARDIRKMATALVVSAPPHTTRFPTTRFSAVWKENGTDLWQRYLFNIIDGLCRIFLSHVVTSPNGGWGCLRRPQQHQVSITTPTVTSVAF